MKKRDRSNHRGRNIVLSILLAVLCIGAAELAACSHFEPETYDRIVAPARYAATVVTDACRAGLDACRAGLEAVGRFCHATAVRAAELAGQAARQVAALWEELTAPKEVVLEVDGSGPPETPEPPPSTAPVVVTEPPLTEVVEEGGKQILTGGSVNITYFCQSDEQWAEQPYGTDPIGPYGCGPTAMAMAVASMTDTDTDPAVMAAWAVEHGYWARRSGSYHSIVRGTARAFGLEVEALPSRTADEVRRVLREGKLLVALVGPGHFTDGGHFILLRGVTLSGDVLVADPNSLERSLELWDPQIVLDELSSARDNGAPLWVLSAPAT